MEYKKILQITVILISQLIIGSCSTGGKASFSGDVDGEQLVTTRRFAGTFLEYRATVTDDLPRVEVVWIKTSLESIFGKICAEGKRCEFRKGDRLYLTRKHYNPGMVGGRWEYFIENDSAVIYKLTDYQSDKHVHAKAWF